MRLPRRHRPRAPRLRLRAWPGVVLRAVKAFDRHQMTDRAATLAYYAVLSVVPILVVAAGTLAVFGAGGVPDKASEAFVRIIRDRASTSATNETAEAIREIVANALRQAQSGASLVVVVSLVLALYGASGAFAAAGRAITEAHELPESRGFVRHRIADTATAVLVIALVLLATVLIIVGGSISTSLFDGLGVGDVAAATWSIARIPVGIVAILLAFDIVYARAPDRRSRKIRLASAGAVTALIVWTIVTALFGTYLQLIGIGSAYGALGGVVVVLAWLWLSAGAFLLGAEVDAEAERSLARAMAPATPDSPAAEAFWARLARPRRRVGWGGLRDRLARRRPGPVPPAPAVQADGAAPAPSVGPAATPAPAAAPVAAAVPEPLCRRPTPSGAPPPDRAADLPVAVGPWDRPAPPAGG